MGVLIWYDFLCPGYVHHAVTCPHMFDSLFCLIKANTAKSLSLLQPNPLLNNHQ